MDLSIIIVNYNTFELTRDLIQSVQNTVKNIQYDIYIVDNHSAPKVRGHLKKTFKNTKHLHLIFNDDNLGFSKANNIALRQCSGEYVLVINSDTIVKDNCVENCIKFLKSHGDIGALGCKLLLGDSTLDHACKRGFPSPSASLFYFLKLHKLFPNSRLFGKYTMSYVDDNQVSEVDSLTGAFMLLPHKIIDKVGIFDEDFFMYGEDLDWCYRIKEAGYKVVYYPKEVTIHLKGQSSNRKKPNKIIYEFHRAMILFYDKHYKDKYPFFINWIMYGGIWIRYGLSYCVNWFRK